mgnify:CR=1 FL=1
MVCARYVCPNFEFWFDDILHYEGMMFSEAARDEITKIVAGNC